MTEIIPLGVLMRKRDDEHTDNAFYTYIKERVNLMVQYGDLWERLRIDPYYRDYRYFNASRTINAVSRLRDEGIEVTWLNHEKDHKWFIQTFRDEEDWATTVDYDIVEIQINKSSSYYGRVQERLQQIHDKVVERICEAVRTSPVGSYSIRIEFSEEEDNVRLNKLSKTLLDVHCLTLMQINFIGDENSTYYEVRWESA